mgnify:CR=1 FL=1
MVFTVAIATSTVHQASKTCDICPEHVRSDGQVSFYPWRSIGLVMVTENETAPSFTATVGTSDHESFDLEEHLGSGPVVLAFFPGAFTPPCSNEMVALQEHLDDFQAAGATLFGISADSPFSQGAFREEHGIEFDLVSDMSGEVIEAYDLEIEIPELGLHGIPNRAVFVLDEEGTVTYSWVADDPTNEPDYEELLDAVESA